MRKQSGDSIIQQQELMLCLRDSLWYAVIMRIAKICEDDKQVNSIYKVFNCCGSNPEIAKQELITIQEIEEMRRKLNITIFDESGDSINLVKSWRDKYLAHYSKLVTPLSTQKEFLITSKKLDSIVETLLKILMILNKKFNININDIYVEKRVELLRKQYDYLYNLYQNN